MFSKLFERCFKGLFKSFSVLSGLGSNDSHAKPTTSTRYSMHGLVLQMYHRCSLKAELGSSQISVIPFAFTATTSTEHSSHKTISLILRAQAIF